MKKLASTETRLTSRCTARCSVKTSCPNTLALPPSFRSSVESRRTSVDLPEPFWPRIATHSPRRIVKLTSRNAGIVLYSAFEPAFVLSAAPAAELLAKVAHLDGGND